MSAPALTRFADRLHAALEAASRSGRMTIGGYESLLVTPDFDASAFDRFQAAAREAGVEPPQTEEVADVPPAPGEGVGADRDLLDIYLRDIGRIPLLEHPELLALAVRSRAVGGLCRQWVMVPLVHSGYSDWCRQVSCLRISSPQRRLCFSLPMPQPETLRRST